MNPSRRGMTFLEISVVVLIIGMLAAIGTPHFARSARMRATRNAAIELARYIDYVRSVAINEGRTTTLTIDDSGDRLTSPDVDFPDRIGTAISIAVKERFDPSLELSTNLGATDTVRFDLEGTPWSAESPLASGVVRITSYDVGYEIRFGSGQGQVTIVEFSATPVGPSAPDVRSIDAGEV